MLHIGLKITHALPTRPVTSHVRAVLYPYANLIIPYLRAGVRIDHRRTPHPRSVRLRTALRLRTSPSNARSPSLPYSIFTLYIKAYERYTTLEKIPFSAMRPQLILFAHSADLLSTSVAKKKIDPFAYRKSEEKIQPSAPHLMARQLFQCGRYTGTVLVPVRVTMLQLYEYH